MDLKAKVAELEKARLDFITQAEKQVAFFDGQIAALKQLLEEENPKEEDKT